MAELLGAQGVGTLLGTGDAFKSSRLERMLSNFAASYKMYWLKGVFEEVCAGRTEMTFAHVVARMVACAWYPVVYFRLNLGASDVLAECIDCARSQLGLRPDAAEREIVEAVEGSANPELARRVKSLHAYVPYRLIRPFYQDRIAEERARVANWADRMANPAIARFNRQDAAGAPYVFNEALDGLTVQPDWAAYFRENQHVIRGWIDMKLVQYLQARNPSVPAIPLKLYPPQARDLSAATRYWREALALAPMREIYTNQPFDDAHFSKMGQLSIDHFIPWSFVLHDEPWNLAPMFRNTNSSKGDRLPNLDDFLAPFANQQFSAAMAVRNTGRHKKVLEAYLQVEPNLAQFEDTPACRVAFAESIARVVRPLHQIASNQGFALWHPSYEYAVGEF